MTYCGQCGHGERAMMGASILERAGRKDLAVLEEGIGAWLERRPLTLGPGLDLDARR